MQEPPPAYPGHGGGIHQNGDGGGVTSYGNYPEQISEMPGVEAVRGHEMGAR